MITTLARLLTAAAFFAVLVPSTADGFYSPAGDPTVQMARQCERVYTRAEAHKAFRSIFRNPTRVSRFEAKVIRRVIRCQATDRGRKVMRRHLARYRRHHRLAPPGNRGIAYIMLWKKGQLGQFGCLDALWTKESGWSTTADNPNSDAYGIPQALPGSKMSSAGADWATNPATQIRWGLGYLAGRYGGPCGGWNHFRLNGWY